MLHTIIRHHKRRLRKFTVGINGLEFTRDAQIKYLAQIFLSQLYFILIFFASPFRDKDPLKSA